MGGFLQQTAGQWLANFLSDILQTSLPEFQSYENSVEENESLSTYWQRDVATRILDESPSLAVDGTSFLQTEAMIKSNIQVMLYTCRHVHWLWDPQIWDKSHQLGSKWTAPVWVLWDWLPPLENSHSMFSEVLSQAAKAPDSTSTF